jgi:phasin family protein
MSFTTMPVQLIELQKSQLAVMNSLRETLFSAAEKAFQLNTAAARTAFRDGAETTQTLFGAKDPQQMFSLSGGLAAPAIEKLASYSRGAYDIFSGTSAEFLKIAESHVAQTNRQIAQFADLASRNSPFGSTPTASLMMGMVGATQSALEAGLKGVRQAAQWAEASFETLDAATATVGTAASEEGKTRGRRAASA